VHHLEARQVPPDDVAALRADDDRRLALRLAVQDDLRRQRQAHGIAGARHAPPAHHRVHRVLEHGLRAERGDDMGRRRVAVERADVRVLPDLRAAVHEQPGACSLAVPALRERMRQDLVVAGVHGAWLPGACGSEPEHPPARDGE
jgi:hypothetical protein